MLNVRAEIEPVVIRIVERVRPDPAVGVALDSTLVEGLAFQSLAVVELGFALTDLFEVSVTPEEAFGLVTVSDVLDIVSARVLDGAGRLPSTTALAEWEAGYHDDELEYP